MGSGDIRADGPPYRDALPEALRVFLSTVHAGFTDLDEISYGPAPPRDMQNYSVLNLREAVRNWETNEDIPGGRAMLIAKGLGDTRYFVSPDLPRGTIGWEADGHMERPLEFARTFDELMSYGFQLERDRPPETTAPETPPAPEELRQVKRVPAQGGASGRVEPRTPMRQTHQSCRCPLFKRERAAVRRRVPRHGS
ncbi:hypothetical protein [Nocardia sp. CY41]|uniref:hypothetical protein n=1 Tax=Nocardia sp. CY41 TaxID=2608686 RepID=UPI00135840D2|nr:hypothetical protein [Nocardia sp. CY41]